MRKNANLQTLNLYTHAIDFDATVVWVGTESCMAQLKNGDEIARVLSEMGDDGHLLFDESVEDREDFTECIRVVDDFGNDIVRLLEGLGLAKNTICILSAEEDSSFLGKCMTDFRLGPDDEANAVVIYCEALHSRLGHSQYGLNRELLITIAHELGHVYTGKIYDDDGHEIVADDHHGPDEDEVEAFGRVWADSVLDRASESDIELSILRLKQDIDRLKSEFIARKNPLPKTRDSYFIDSETDEARRSTEGYQTYYHATDREITNLERDVEIFLAPDKVTAYNTAAAGNTYIYEVHVPTGLNVFEPLSVFQDPDRAREMASYLEEIRDFGEIEDDDMYGIDVNEVSATAYFCTRSNYTDLGRRIMDACEAWEEDVESIYNTFVISWPNSALLGRHVSCLQRFGYEGRFEQESSMSPDFDESYSLCVFDQRNCRLGRLVDGPDT